jgi:parvulin-like peptidyl-prolyl isomerase
MGKPAAGRVVAKKGYQSFFMLGLGALAVLAVGWLIGMYSSSSQAVAGPPEVTAKNNTLTAPLGPEPSPDYSRRVVARIYNNIDITREELGEYLIARFGADRLEHLVNRRIIDHACQQKGIEVTEAEVDAALDADCRDLGVDRKQFLDTVLKQYRKTVYEWKEDVLRPRLLLGKLSSTRVQVSEDEIQKAFESKYGEKVEVRILLYPKGPGQERVVTQIYEQVRTSDVEFDRAARSQPNSNLAMNGGKIPPICRHSDNEQVEKVAFSLKPGELSERLDTPEGWLIMKCVQHMAPDRRKILENEHDALKEEVAEKKKQKEVGEIFKELKKQAGPVLYLEADKTVAGLKCAVREELGRGN